MRLFPRKKCVFIQKQPRPVLKTCVKICWRGVKKLLARFRWTEESEQRSWLHPRLDIISSLCRHKMNILESTPISSGRLRSKTMELPIQTIQQTIRENETCQNINKMSL